MTFEIFVFLVIVALAFDFLNGFHDAANSIATIVSTGAMSPQWAIVWAAFFNFIAFLFFGLHVAATIGKGIVDPGVIDHYVVFGGSIFAIFCAITYWFPKMFGRMMNEPLAKLHFWGTLIFFNLTFFPMHIIGVGGHMRRIYNPMQYEFLQPLQHWNVVMTVGALGLGAVQLIFAFNFFYSLFFGAKAERNPWRACTLEWEAPTPVPHGNFGKIPTVYHGPYEYSVPGEKEDYLPQAQPGRSATAHH